MRLDKYLCDCLDFSRSEIKKFIRNGMVKIDSTIICDPSIKISPDSTVYFDNSPILYNNSRIFCLNKPAGYVTASEDKHSNYVMQLINEPNSNRLFAVGRLDKDTTGLLLITDDGKLAHDLTSPSRHVEKTYLVTLQSALEQSAVIMLEEGVDIGDDKPTKPARVEVIDEAHIKLSITEGRFHQVKRMMEAVNNKVIELKRIRFGNLILPADLAEGEYIPVKKEDIC